MPAHSRWHAAVKAPRHGPAEPQSPSVPTRHPPAGCSGRSGRPRLRYIVCTLDPRLRSPLWCFPIDLRHSESLVGVRSVAGHCAVSAGVIASGLWCSGCKQHGLLDRLNPSLDADIQGTQPCFQEPGPPLPRKGVPQPCTETWRKKRQGESPSRLLMFAGNPKTASANRSPPTTGHSLMTVLLSLVRVQLAVAD